jgi:hypothetical protein
MIHVLCSSPSTDRVSRADHHLWQSTPTPPDSSGLVLGVVVRLARVPKPMPVVPLNGLAGEVWADTDTALYQSRFALIISQFT